MVLALVTGAIDPVIVWAAGQITVGIQLETRAMGAHFVMFAALPPSSVKGKRIVFRALVLG